MSATIAAALKKLAVAVITDKKTRRAVIGIVLGILVLLIMPVIAVVSIFNNSIEIDTDRLQTMVVANLFEKEQQRLQAVENTMYAIENEMTAAGFGSRVKEAQVLYVLALYDYIMAAKEDLLYKALQVQVSREYYCQKADTRFLEELNHKRPRTMDEVEELWYNGYGGRHIHYDDSRYHALNLHSVFSKGTIEFRMFNSTLHAGEIKSYIQLCLAISHQALVQRGASRIKTQPENEKYTFRTWLLRLGLIGDEFKTARHHLLKNLEGNIAWRDPAQAQAQKERFAAKRQAEQEMAEEPINEPDEQEHDAPAFSMSMSM